ncbi:uncharacterized protein LOC117171370 isoform X1 [Belonocnema kinseyi]|uniref:uncharacterized protein LOC117171370 isoform X1 n=1 Tax=Belonocnema kinseyi TaxID=2817044 RepID=UPI00143DC8A2|nr:uncharacterized protein LOC117171370 isoform X1 [Belonocnema kinseyi]
MVTLLGMFVKEDILDIVDSVANIDLNSKNNLKSLKNVKLGHAVRAELKKIQASEADLSSFKENFRFMIKVMCEKLIERSPIKYNLCKGITFSDHNLIHSFGKKVYALLEMALEEFLERNWLIGSQCDEIAIEFKELSAQPTVHLRLKPYDRKKERLDTFWMSVLTDYGASDLLVSFMKKTLILSHGNAFVKRGFSINKELIVENHLSRSLVAQRQVYDAV